MSVGLSNISCKSVTIKSKTVVAKVMAANVVPFSMAPNLEREGKKELKKQYEEQIHSQTVQDVKYWDNVQAPEVKLEPLSPKKENCYLKR